MQAALTASTGATHVVQRLGESVSIDDGIELKMNGEKKGSLQWEQAAAWKYAINGVEGEVAVLVGIGSDLRGKGFGSAMMARFASLAKSAGKTEVFAHGVLDTAEGFYEKMGMKKVPDDTFDNWVGDTDTVVRLATASWESKKAANKFVNG